jgi:hypothetical protein
MLITTTRWTEGRLVAAEPGAVELTLEQAESAAQVTSASVVGLNIGIGETKVRHDFRFSP